MSTTEAAEAAPLNDAMLMMDVVDTLRHSADLPLASDGRSLDAEATIERLRTSYRQAGIEAPEAVLLQGIAAMGDGRFTYTPRTRGVAANLARLYVSRTKWGRPVFALFLALVIGLGGYAFGYRPYKESQVEAARVELAQGLPAQMDALYQEVFNETKVQAAADDAADLRNRGKDAAHQGNRAVAEEAVARLTALHDQLRLSYALRVVDRDGVKPGFWTFPPSNAEATNYYVVVEAIDPDGKALKLPIADENSGITKTVSQWGLRVPQSVYDAVIADKQDDGIIQHYVVGFKQDGFVDVDYVIPVLGGAVTQW
jgi:hypothetical protein